MTLALEAEKDHLPNVSQTVPVKIEPVDRCVPGLSARLPHNWAGFVTMVETCRARGLCKIHNGKVARREGTRSQHRRRHCTDLGGAG